MAPALFHIELIGEDAAELGERRLVPGRCPSGTARSGSPGTFLTNFVGAGPYSPIGIGSTILTATTGGSPSTCNCAGSNSLR